MYTCMYVCLYVRTYANTHITLQQRKPTPTSSPLIPKLCTWQFSTVLFPRKLLPQTPDLITSYVISGLTDEAFKKVFQTHSCMRFMFLQVTYPIHLNPFSPCLTNVFADNFHVNLDS